MSKGAFKAFIKDAKKQDTYWVEKAILEFTSELYKLMLENGVSKKEMANTIGTSPAYITKVFSGNANFTIESMVKLTRALEGKLSIHVSHKDSKVIWRDVIDGKNMRPEEAKTWATVPSTVGIHKKRVAVHE